MKQYEKMAIMEVEQKKKEHEKYIINVYNCKCIPAQKRRSTEKERIQGKRFSLTSKFLYAFNFNFSDFSSTMYAINKIYNC